MPNLIQCRNSIVSWAVIWRLVLGTAFAILFSTIVSAATIIADPDGFSLGTDLTNAFSGVSLSVTGNGSNNDASQQTVIAVSGFSPFNNANLATTGTQVFGKDPFNPGGCNGCVPAVWNEFAFNLLRADFDNPTDFVQIDLIFRDDDTAFLRAYDALDNLLAEIIRSGDGRADDPGEEPFFTVSISRGLSDISYITAGGLGGEGAYLDNLQFNAIQVPEPATLTIFILGLVALGAALRRPKIKLTTPAPAGSPQAFLAYQVGWPTRDPASALCGVLSRFRGHC